MFHYKDCQDLYVMSCISNALQTHAQKFEKIFQKIYEDKKKFVNDEMSAIDILILSSPAQKAKFKSLDFDQLIVSCALESLNQMQFQKMAFDEAELCFSAMTQYLCAFLDSKEERFEIQMKNQKMHHVTYGRFKFFDVLVSKKLNFNKNIFDEIIENAFYYQNRNPLQNHFWKLFWKQFSEKMKMNEIFQIHYDHHTKISQCLQKHSVFLPLFSGIAQHDVKLINFAEEKGAAATKAAAEAKAGGHWWLLNSPSKTAEPVRFWIHSTGFLDMDSLKKSAFRIAQTLFHVFDQSNPEFSKLSINNTQHEVYLVVSYYPWLYLSWHAGLHQLKQNLQK
jgi:hypothetical protein